MMKKLSEIIGNISTKVPSLIWKAMGVAGAGAFLLPLPASGNQESVDVATLEAWRTLPKVMEKASLEQVNPNVRTVVYNGLKSGVPDYTIFNLNKRTFTHDGTIDELLSLGENVGIDHELKDVLSELGKTCNEKLQITGYDNYVVVKPANGLLEGSVVIVNQGSMGYVAFTLGEISDADGWSSVFNGADLVRHKLLKESFPSVTYNVTNPEGERVQLTYGIQNGGLIITETRQDGTSDVSFTDTKGNTILSALSPFGKRVGFYDSVINNKFGITLDRTIEPGAFEPQVESAQSVNQGVYNAGDACNPNYKSGFTSIPWKLRREAYEKTIGGIINDVLKKSEKYKTDECVSCN